MASTRMDEPQGCRKGKSTERIDGIVAAIMALGRALNQPPPSRNVYKDRGIIIV